MAIFDSFVCEIRTTLAMEECLDTIGSYISRTDERGLIRSLRSTGCEVSITSNHVVVIDTNDNMKVIFECTTAIEPVSANHKFVITVTP